jgi:hypothetical protein
MPQHGQITRRLLQPPATPMARTTAGCGCASTQRLIRWQCPQACCVTHQHDATTACTPSRHLYTNQQHHCLRCTVCAHQAALVPQHTQASVAGTYRNAQADCDSQGWHPLHQHRLEQTLILLRCKPLDVGSHTPITGSGRLHQDSGPLQQAASHTHTEGCSAAVRTILWKERHA